MNMSEVEADILADLHELADPYSQHLFLIECGNEISGIDEELHSEEHLVRDCDVRTWIRTSWAGGVLKIVGNSESLIVRGAVALLVEIYDGRDANEVAAYRCRLLDDPLFAHRFSPRQQAGLKGIVKKVGEDAAAWCV